MNTATPKKDDTTEIEKSQGSKPEAVPFPELKAFPMIADVQMLRDYLDWHVKNGRGGYVCELREHYPCIPPQGETHDDYDRLVFIRGVH